MFISFGQKFSESYLRGTVKDPKPPRLGALVCGRPIRGFKDFQNFLFSDGLVVILGRKNRAAVLNGFLDHFFNLVREDSKSESKKMK
jgi:hypothetical protein